MTKKLEIVVISDLHCCSKRDGKSFYQYDSNDPMNPVRKLDEFIKANSLTADVLIVAGDITNQANRTGLIHAWKSAIQIKNSLQAKYLIGTMGNHDVFRGQKDPFRIPKAQPDFPVRNTENRDSYWRDNFCFREEPEFRVLVINSVAKHFKRCETDKGCITTTDLDKIQRYLHGNKKKNFQLAVLHHHPILHDIPGITQTDIMVNGDNLLTSLSDFNFDIVIHGHRHHPKIRYSAGGHDSLPVFACGSFAAFNDPFLNSITRNVFHKLTLYKNKKDERAFGVIHTWEYGVSCGWQPTTTRSANIPFSTGFGCRENLDKLAKEIVAHFNKYKKEFCDLKEICKGIPQLNYLIPDDQGSLKRILKIKKINVDFEAEDRGIGRSR